MDKTGELTESSPCHVCGKPGIAFDQGAPVCDRHRARVRRPEPMPEGVRKLAADLQEER